MRSRLSLPLALLGAGIAVSLLPGAAIAQSVCSTNRDVFRNPFNSDSAHHRPIGTGARYASDSHAATRDWLKAGGLAVNPGTTFWGGFAVRGSAGDPARRVNVDPLAAQLGQANRTFGLPATTRMSNEAAKRPVKRSSTGVSDSQTQVYDETTGKLHEFYRFDWNGGNPIAWGHRSLDIRGLGHGTRAGQRLGPTAAGTSFFFGLLRGDQINKAGHSIDHALAASLPRMGGSNKVVMLSRRVILPATGKDSNSAAPNNTGNIPYGALMALPPNVNIQRLGLSEPGRRLAAAIRDYGIYVVDGTGSNQGAIKADQHVSSSIRNQLIADIRKIYPHIRMVLNSTWQPGQAAVGGGTPLARNCAFDAGATSSTASSGTSSNSTPQSSPSTSPSSTGSSGGELSWAAVKNATNYYVEIREGSGKGKKVFGGMVRPAAGGCPNGTGTCSRELPSLAAGKSYVWNVRAVVGGKTQSPTSWQQVGGNSSASSTASNSTPQSSSSSPSSASSSGGELSWAAVKNAKNYYVEIREGSGKGPKAFGGMVRPAAGGCPNGTGTCSRELPSLANGKSYVWNVRAVVGGKTQSPTSWQEVG